MALKANKKYSDMSLFTSQNIANILQNVHTNINKIRSKSCLQ